MVKLRARHALLLVAVSVTGVAAEAQAPEPYARTIIVSPVPGDGLASGDELRAAVASVTPTASSPWLIKLEPGTYDLGADYLQLKPHLDIEGSGIDVTTIQGSGQAMINRSRGVLMGADDMEVRGLNLRCIGSAETSGCIAMANLHASPRLTDLLIVSKEPFGANWGIRNSGSSPQLDRVEINASHGISNYGIVNSNGLGGSESHPTIRRSVILVKGGSNQNIGILDRSRSSSVLVEDSTVTAFGGQVSAAMRGLEHFHSDPVVLRRVTMLAHSASEVAAGVGTSAYASLTVEDSEVVALGSTSHGVNPTEDFIDYVTDVFVDHSRVSGETTVVGGVEVDITNSELDGAGSVTGDTTHCAAVVDAARAFYPDTCP